MQFITEKHKQILKDHDHFQQEASVYTEKMCGKITEARGIDLDKLQPKLEFFKSQGPTSSEIKWVEDFLDTHSRARCCLPKGHKGACKHKLDTLVPPEFKNKIAGCFQLEGNIANHSGSPFLNRQSRICPIQLLSSAKIDLGRVDESFAIPIKRAGTGFTCATAYFDWASLLTLQQGFELNSFYDQHILTYREHAEFLTHYYQSTYRLKIVNNEGYLCDPFTFETLKLSWWTEGKLIQFGHVEPVSETKYLTRGLNTIPMTRSTNMLQGDRSWNEFIETLRKHIALH